MPHLLYCSGWSSDHGRCFVSAVKPPRIWGSLAHFRVSIFPCDAARDAWNARQRAIFIQLDNRALPVEWKGDDVSLSMHP